MVSLTERIEYNRSIEDKPKIVHFNRFINGENYTYNIPDDINETDRSYFSLLEFISQGQKEEFINVYREFSRRQPSTESVWIHNEFLIFVLICGIEKYAIDKAWINEAIRVRATGNQQYLAINQTFRNILSGNIQSTDNLPAIVIVFQELMNRPQLSKAMLDSAYLLLSRTSDLVDTRDDFLISISLRAFDIIFLASETPGSVEISKLKSFKKIFQKRVQVITNIIYYTLLFIFIIVIIKYTREYSSFKDYVSDLGAAFQIGGLAFLAAFRWIRKQIEFLIHKSFGYYGLFHEATDELE